MNKETIQTILERYEKKINVLKQHTKEFNDINDPKLQFMLGEYSQLLIDIRMLKDLSKQTIGE